MRDHHDPTDEDLPRGLPAPRGEPSRFAGKVGSDESGARHTPSRRLPVVTERGRDATVYRTRESQDVDARALAEQLAEGLTPGSEVRFDRGSRALYATDGSNYRQVPIGVVVPRTVDDIVRTVSICRAHGAPILGRGGGTSLAGQCTNVAVVIDCSKYLHRVLALDVEGRRAVVEPGCVLDTLRHAAWRHHLTFAPDPSTHDHCTLGGMIGNDSCGVHSVMGGKTVDNVESLDILTYDGLRLRVGATSDEELARLCALEGRVGDIYRGLRTIRDEYGVQIRQRFPDIPRRVSGYNLDQLLPENGFHVARALVGTESTCAMVLEAELRLVPWPRARTLVVLGYPSVYEAGDHVPQILEWDPIGLEGIDDRLVEDMKKMRVHPEDVRLLPDGAGFLLVEFGGVSKADSDDKARRMMHALGRHRHAPSMKLFDDDSEEAAIWKVRESGLGATAHVPGGQETWEGWEDSAVPPARLGEYLRKLRSLFDAYGYGCALYGHFGQGCVHTRIDFDLRTAPGVAKYRRFVEEAADLVVSLGGSLSGEHGDGQSRAELLPKMFGEELVGAFREFKALWDPDGRMNPGKKVEPYRIDQNLRIGPAWRPATPTTHFSFRDQGGSFTEAAMTCVGVGECRRLDGGTMCPSYRATREEAHSTRGRARLLWEMLEGNPLDGGWRSEAVKEALDLCLSCKGCKGDCPVRVDMATYKAEFLSHYYEGRLRPIHAYAIGLVHWWLRLGSRLPRLVNAILQAPLVGELLRLLAGLSPRRAVPRLAEETFRRWLARREAVALPPPLPSLLEAAHDWPRTAEGRPRVILWADTWSDHFHPGTARAALSLLESMGLSVEVPPVRLCCGRPLYDYGMLDLAKRKLRQTLDALAGPIAEGVPLVGLEPSCLSVFRDELPNLFPDDPAAQRLAKQSFALSEFLVEKVPGWRPPTLKRRAIVQGHCHHKADLRWKAERKLLDEMGLDLDVLDAGCCGMAGGFGFEREHVDVSLAVGEHRLLPAVRDAPRDAFVVADGFSCREQIAQSTERRAVHLAELLELARRDGPDGPAGELPERGVVALDGQTPGRPSMAGVGLRASLARLGPALAVGGALALGGLTVALVGRRALGRGRRPLLPRLRARIG